MQRTWANGEYLQKKMSPRIPVKSMKDSSRFERAVQGMRAKDMAYKHEITNGNNTNDNCRGYGVVASLCSRFMEAEKRGYMRTERGTPRVKKRTERPDHGTNNQDKQLRHKEVTRQLLKQAIEGPDFALLRIIIRMSPGVKDYLNDRDENGSTLLHRSCEEGNLRLLTLLVELGLDVNSAGENKRTPLHIASLHNNIEIVNLLLNSCADVFAKDTEGSRPVDLCSEPRVRSALLSRMSSRSRSFNTRRTRPVYNKPNMDLNLMRTDSGIILDNNTIDENYTRRKLKSPMSPNRLLSSFRDFRFSKETIV